MDDLELIKSKINIVDLISEYLPLKKAGVNFKSNCPFHSEKSPSFVVSPERGIWHCFGCNLGGDIFTFLMKKEGIEFTEALETLAKKAGVTLKRIRNDPGKAKRDRLYEVNQKAVQFYHYILTEHLLGKKALMYLKKRGLNDATIKQFNLGYSPNSWDQLSKFLTKRGFNNTELIDAGLVVPSQSGVYDRFRGRIMFPLVDVKGQVIGFSGRVLDGGEPKYVNTPQTQIFDKGQFLYGLNLAKDSIRKQDFAVLSEGEMDMLLSYQSGVENVVASKGTGLTTSQIELVKKYTDNLSLCFDTDSAGDSASRRGIEMLERGGFNIKVIKIEGGKDPAEVVLTDPQAWLEAVEAAEPIYDYYLKSASLRFDLNLADGKKRLGEELFPIWAKIADPMTKEHYTQKLSALLGMGEDLIRRQIKSANTTSVVSFEAVVEKVEKSPVNAISRRLLLEEYLISLLLKIPKDQTFVPKFPETVFTTESLQSLYVFLVLFLDKIAFKAADFEIDQFSKSLPPELVETCDRLYLTEIDGKLTASHWNDEVSKVFGELKKSLVKASLEKLSAQIKNAQAFGKINELETLNRRFRDLSVKLKSL